MGLVTSLYHRDPLYNALLFFIELTFREANFVSDGGFHAVLMGWNSYPQYGFQPRYLSEFPLPILKHAQREENQHEGGQL